MTMDKDTSDEGNATNQPNVANVALSPKTYAPQISLMKQVLYIFLGIPDGSYLSLDDIVNRISLGTRPDVKKKTVRKCIERFRKRAVPLIEQVIVAQGAKAYRLTSRQAATGYLDGIPPDIKSRVTPSLATSQPMQGIIHRRVLPLRLSSSEVEVVRSKGRKVGWGKHGQYYHQFKKEPAFTIHTWPSGKALLYIGEDWITQIEIEFGHSLVEKAMIPLQNGKGHTGIAIPIPFPGDWQDYLPVGQRFYVLERDGSTSVIQYGFSQIREGELDLHGSGSVERGRSIVEGIVNDTKFRTDVSNWFLNIEKQIESLPHRIIDPIMVAITDVLEEHGISKPPVYRPSTSNMEDFSYG